MFRLTLSLSRIVTYAGHLKSSSGRSWLDEIITGCTRASSSPFCGQTSTSAAVLWETSFCQVCVECVIAALSNQNTGVLTCDCVLVQAGTRCCRASLSVCSRRSDTWFLQIWARACGSSARGSETSPCGAAERRWPSCPTSAAPGSVRRSTRSSARRSSSGSASELILMCF